MENQGVVKSEYLSIWRLISGIVSVFLGSIIFLIDGGLLEKIVHANVTFSDCVDFYFEYLIFVHWSVWILFAFLFVAGNISIISWKSKQNRAYIATDIFYLLCVVCSVVMFYSLKLKLNTMSVCIICAGIWELVCIIFSELTRRKSNELDYTKKYINGFAIASLVCAFSSLPILGIVYGIIAIEKCGVKSDIYNGKRLAVAGLVLSIIGFIVTFWFQGWGIIAMYTRTSVHTIDYMG